ncbi:MAG: MarP family serine protease [Acidimicrobiales bacterium]
MVSVLGVNGFDWVDVLVIVLALIAAARGLRLGAAVQVLSYGGFWLGLVVGALIAPTVANGIHNSVTKAAVSLAIVFGVAIVLGAVGRAVGGRLWRGLRRSHLGGADAVAGVGVAAGATLLGCWLVGTILVQGPVPAVSNGIGESGILRALDRVMPPAPSVFTRIESFVNTSGLPQVFNHAPPPPAGPVSVASASQVSHAVAADGGSMVKVYGQGCGQIQEGSGFVVAPDLVVTNAHVVAGIPDPKVIGTDGSYHSAVAIAFDPNFDLAVLRTSGLGEPALHLDTAAVGRGTKAVVLGYPGGGPFAAGPAGVMSVLNAEGPNIYGQGSTIRTLYDIQANVQPGNSGGPLVEPDGEVIGVVFSKSVSDPDVGYALASPGVASRVAAARANPSNSGTGACAG